MLPPFLLYDDSHIKLVHAVVWLQLAVCDYVPLSAALGNLNIGAEKVADCPDCLVLQGQRHARKDEEQQQP